MKKLRIILQSNYFYLFLMLFVAILLYFNACDKSKYDINDDVIIGTITSYYIDTDKLVILKASFKLSIPFPSIGVLESFPPIILGAI